MNIHSLSLSPQVSNNTLGVVKCGNNLLKFLVQFFDAIRAGLFFWWNIEFYSTIVAIVFLALRAVSRADGFSYQQSFISLVIAFNCWKQMNEMHEWMQCMNEWNGKNMKLIVLHWVQCQILVLTEREIFPKKTTPYGVRWIYQKF